MVDSEVAYQPIMCYFSSHCNMGLVFTHVLNILALPLLSDTFEAQTRLFCLHLQILKAKKLVIWLKKIQNLTGAFPFYGLVGLTVY